jgi:hypothetical protein
MSNTTDSSRPRPSDFPADASAYHLGQPIGYGAFATVYKANVTEGPRTGENVCTRLSYYNHDTVGCDKGD